MIDWGMYTAAGNRAVDDAMTTLHTRINSGEVRRMTLESDLTKVIAAVGKEHHEIGDTVVRNRIYNEVDVWCDKQGWKRLYV